MSDNDGKKTLGVRGGPRAGNVKQSFSHGRTKNVVVETKRKRIVKPTTATPSPAASGKAAAPGSSAKRPAGISDAEMERRMKALQAAKEREAEDAAKREAEEQAREADRKRRREEAEAKEREEQERAERAKAKAEADERAKAEAEAAAQQAAAAAAQPAHRRRNVALPRRNPHRPRASRTRTAISSAVARAVAMMAAGRASSR